MVKYVGLVSMGPNYSQPDPSTDAYVWDTLDSVRASLRSIARGRGANARVAEWDADGSARAGYVDHSLTPCADDVDILLWRNALEILDAMEHETRADYVLTVGPHDGIKTERI